MFVLLSGCSIRTAQIDKPDGTTLYYWTAEAFTFTKQSGMVSSGDFTLELDQSEHKPDTEAMRVLIEGITDRLLDRLEVVK